MKFISCYIQGFGTLKDKSYKFNDGINQFLCDNGFGKSTLLAFIRAMLYGLDYKQGTNKFYERIHFKPWDEGDWGGSLDISLESNNYKIVRSFGRKRTEDTFKLYNLDTMQESEDYGEDIGEKIFEVDKDSFEKSVFFGQQGLETGLTTSLNTKMGNLSNVKDDMNQFDNAIDNIEKIRLQYESKSKTNPGKIHLINEKIRECEEAKEHIPILEKALRDRIAGIDEKKKQIEKILEVRKSLTDKIKAAGEKKEALGQLNAKKEQHEKLKLQLDTINGFFGGKLPEEDRLRQIQEQYRELIEKQSRLSEIQSLMPTEERQEFLKSVFADESSITREEIELSVREAEEISKLRTSGEVSSFPEDSRKNLEKINRFFANKIPVSEEIEALIRPGNHINQTKVDLGVVESKISEENIALEAIGKTKSPPFSMIILGIIFVITGFFALNEFESAQLIFIPTGLFAVAAIWFIAFFIIRIKRRSIAVRGEEIRARLEDLEDKRKELVSEISAYENKCIDFINLFPEVSNSGEIVSSLLEIQRKLIEYNGLMELYEIHKKDNAKKTDDLAGLTLGLYTRLSPYSEKYNLNLYENHEESVLLSRLLEDIKIYDNYLLNAKKIAGIAEEINILRENIEEYMSQFVWEGETDIEAKILKIGSFLDNYKIASEQILEIGRELSALDVEDTGNEQNSLENLQEEIHVIDEKYEPLVSDKAREEEELSRISNEIEGNEEIANILPALLEKREEMLYKVSVLQDTKKYLEQAKEEILSVYLNPLRKRMEHYLDRFIPEKISREIEVSLDMDLSIKLLRRGNIYSGEYLSDGYRDITAMCARLALIDTLYRGDKPPFLMDDPFVNLDDKKIQKALSVLSSISGDTQIIYLTCHESRILNSEGLQSI